VAPVQDFGDGRRGRRPAQGERGEIVGGSGAGHPSSRAADPPRHGAAVRPQGPALAARRLDKREDRVERAFERLTRADPIEIVARRAIAGEQEMVAVVDPAAEFGIEIRTTAPTGVPAGLVEPHRPTGVGERGRGGEPGEPGAHDMGLAAHDPALRRRRAIACSLLK
jgi:hypothetical protein